MVPNSNTHFAQSPITGDAPRSTFNRPSGWKGTFNAGELIPVYVDEVYPHDSSIMGLSTAIRMATPIYPVMDDCWIDFYAFYAPMRQLWTHTKEFFGEPTVDPWEQKTEYEVPVIESPDGGWDFGTLADYMGIPPKVELKGENAVNALPFRMYASIYNEWFRDENLMKPAALNLDDATQVGSNGSNYITDIQLGGKPAHSCKPFDYFTACLPEPQRGPDIMLPLGDKAPVKAGEDNESLIYNTPTHYAMNNASDIKGLKVKSSFNRMEGTQYNAIVRTDPYDDNNGMTPINLWANLSGATGATINEFRQAYAVQRYYETMALKGARYREYVNAFFHVTTPNAEVQVPEFLGGCSVRINMQQVVQTSSTGADTTPQGNVAGLSLTNALEQIYSKGFTEHGYVMILATVRTQHTYSQGIERMWSRKGPLTMYNPAFANLGEQAVLNKEIYADGSAKDNEAFGYQEAWAELRYKPSRVCNDFRPTHPQSLSSWSYAEKYDKCPVLGQDWIQETKNNVENTLAVQGDAPQFICDIRFNDKITRELPMYSIPGIAGTM